MPSVHSDLPHPAYGFAAETRLRILRDADLMGIRAAAEVHSVSLASIYIWRKRYDIAAHHSALPTSTKDH